MQDGVLSWLEHLGPCGAWMQSYSHLVGIDTVAIPLLNFIEERTLLTRKLLIVNKLIFK